MLRKYQRNYDGAIAVSQNILQRDPTFQLGYSMLAAGYFCEHRWPEWLATDAKLPQDDVLRAIASGKTDEARKFLKQYVNQAQAGLRRPYDVFRYSIEIGDKEQGLEWLEKSYQHRDYWLLFINVDPEMDPVRSDPRFQEIVRRLGVAG